MFVEIGMKRRKMAYYPYNLKDVHDASAQEKFKNQYPVTIVGAAQGQD